MTMTVIRTNTWFFIVVENENVRLTTSCDVRLGGHVRLTIEFVTSANRRLVGKTDSPSVRKPFLGDVRIGGGARARVTDTCRETVRGLVR